MNSIKNINSNIMKIKRQLNNNINIDNIDNIPTKRYIPEKPKIRSKLIPRNTNKLNRLNRLNKLNRPNYPIKKLKIGTKLTNKEMNQINGINKLNKSKSIYLNKNIQDNKSKSSIWSVIYLILIIFILFFIVFLLYNLYIDYLNNQNQNININYQVQKAPKGIIVGQAGAPISVEKTGDITENKYLSIYGGDDFIKRTDSYPQYPQYSQNSPYAQYSQNSYPGYNTNYNASKSNINNYINEQNNYIKRINERVQEINNDRMYTAEYSRDKKSLDHIRNYERLLANKVNQESRSQPYLPDVY